MLKSDIMEMYPGLLSPFIQGKFSDTAQPPNLDRFFYLLHQQRLAGLLLRHDQEFQPNIELNGGPANAFLDTRSVVKPGLGGVICRIERVIFF